MLCRPEAHIAQMHIAYWKIDNLQQCLIAPIEVAAGEGCAVIAAVTTRDAQSICKV